MSINKDLKDKPKVETEAYKDFKRAMSALNKKMTKDAKGEIAIAPLGEMDTIDVETVSTGSVVLDNLAGGGFPVGRIVELFGPESSGKTSIALNAIADVQRKGGNALFIDAEQALDPNYARVLGVDTDKLGLTQLIIAEQVMFTIQEMIKTGTVDLIVVDSVASLVPQAEYDEPEKITMALLARILSKHLRIIAKLANDHRCTVLLLNQIREKVGVMFGCLHANTLVNFTDGRSLPISKVVEEQIEGEVWSYNEKESKFEAKRIVDWHHNGEVENREDFLSFTTDSINSKSGNFGFTVTPNHQVMTEKGWKEAKDITMSDRILSKYESEINGTLKDFLYGTLVGDSYLQIRSKNTASIRFQDSQNPEYLKWKIDKLSVWSDFKQYGKEEDYLKSYKSKYSYELSEIKRGLENRNPLVFFENYSDLGLALWWMDDGTFDGKENRYRGGISVKRFKNNAEVLQRIVDEFGKLGIKATYTLNDGGIRFDKKNIIKLFERIHKYVPEPMQYKIGDEFKGKYEEFELEFSPVIKEAYVSIKAIRVASNTQMRQKGKYDISVEDNHNYLVGGKHNGIIVHNSPEDTPGGRALKFFASQRIRVSRVGQYKEGNEILGTEVQFRVVKNKIAPPFQSGKTILTFAKGINRPAEIIEVGGSLGAIEIEGRTQFLQVKDPSKYEDRYEVVDGKVKLGTSKKACIEALEENEDLFNEAARRVEEIMIMKREGGEAIDPHEEDIISLEDAEADVFSV